MSTQQDKEDREASTLDQTQNPNPVTTQNNISDEDVSPTLNQTKTPEDMVNTTEADETTTTTTTQNLNLDLPHDIITDILKRLPPKSLVRFRCVCKPWDSLLTDPNFVKAHLDRTRSLFQSSLKSNTRLILARYCDTLLSTTDETKNVIQAEELDFPLVKNLPYYVKGHCDGLLCLVINDGNEGMLVIYNPSIQQYRKLPNPPEFQSTREVIGIGYDKVKDDYKVVRVPSNYCRMKCPGYKHKVEVLELKTNVWRQIPDEDTPPYYVEHIFQATEVNGGLYWLVEDHASVMSCVILRFDLAEEKFKVIEPPPDECRRSLAWIGALKDWLCVVHTRRLNDVHVWGTKDDMTWTRIITTSNFPKVPGREPFMDSFRYMPLCYNEKGAVLMSVRGERFLTFDNRNNVFEHVDILGAKHWLQETMYCESLVSPGVGVHQTEMARSSGSAINFVPAEEEQAEDEEETENSSSLLRMMTGLKRELANLLTCTIGLRNAQGR